MAPKAGVAALAASPGVAGMLADRRRAPQRRDRGLGTTLAGRRREHDEPDALDRPPLAALQRGDVLVTIGTSDSGLPRRRWRFLDRRSFGTTTVGSPPTSTDSGPSRLERLVPVLLVAAAVACLATPGWAQEQKEAAYRAFPYVGSRLAIWVIAQIHLNFAAFILGVPIFAVIIEFMGWRIGMDREEGRRYDWLSHELVKLTFTAFSTTALLGGLLLFLLIRLYPRFWTYMSVDLRSHDVAVRRSLLPRDLHRVPLVLRLGLALGAAQGASTSRSASCRTCSAPRSCSSRTPGSPS